MWINRAKYEVEKIQAKQRIEYLENLICPCESHDYRKIDFHIEGGTGRGDEVTIIITSVRNAEKLKTLIKF